MKKGRLLEKEGVQALIASLICILLGVLIGYIVLLCINPAGSIVILLSPLLRNCCGQRRGEQPPKLPIG